MENNLTSERTPIQPQDMRAIRNEFRKGIEQYVQKKHEDASTCFQRAAAAGYFPALLCVGFMHLAGESGSKNRELAQQYYDQANSKLSTLNKKDRELQYDFGLYHVITGQVQRAEACFKAAATQGHYKARYRLAMYCLDLGRDAEAIALLEQADQQGYMEAQFQLGFYYFTRRNVEGNLQRAADYFFKAAPQGHLKAQYHLGLCHEEAPEIAEKHHQITGWSEDRPKTNWLQVAASRGHVGAKQHLEKTSLEAKPLPVVDAKQVQTSPTPEVRVAITPDQLFGVEPSTVDNAVQPFQNQPPSEAPISIRVDNANSTATAEQSAEKQVDRGSRLMAVVDSKLADKVAIEDETAKTKSVPLSVPTISVKSKKDDLKEGYRLYKENKCLEAITPLAAAAEKGNVLACLLLCNLYQEGLGGVEKDPQKIDQYREIAKRKPQWFENNMKKIFSSRLDREHFSQLNNRFIKNSSSSTIKATDVVEEEDHAPLPWAAQQVVDSIPDTPMLLQSLCQEAPPLSIASSTVRNESKSDGPSKYTNLCDVLLNSVQLHARSSEAKRALQELSTTLRESFEADVQRYLNMSSPTGSSLSAEMNANLALANLHYASGMQEKEQQKHDKALQWFALAAESGNAMAIRELVNYRLSGNDEAGIILENIRAKSAQRQQAPTRSTASFSNSSGAKKVPVEPKVAGDTEDRSTSRAQDNASEKPPLGGMLVSKF